MNWRAKPLVNYRVIVDLISATTTDTGLTVRCEFDANPYPKGIAVSDQEIAAINITRADFHGEWNYTIQPSNRSKAHQKPGPFPPPALPSLTGTMTLSDPRPNRRLSHRRGRYPRPGGSPQLRASPVRRAVPPTSADRNGCICRLLPRPTRPSPFLRRVGIRDVTFEACSGFTHVTARRIARPPKAAFVTRLRHGQLPGRAARQLPEQTDNSPGGTSLHW